MNVKEWLGENNTLGIDIWNRKYRYEEESFDQWVDRVSGNNKKVGQLIKDKNLQLGARKSTNRTLEKKKKKISI